MRRRSLLKCVIPMLLVLAPSVALAQGIEADRQRLRTAQDDIRTLRSQYAEAYNAKDAAAVAALYTSDGIMVNSSGEMVAGAEEIASSMASAAPSWPHVVISSDTVRVYGSTAVDVGRFTTHPASGGEKVERYVAVLRRGMDGWRVSHAVLVPATGGK
ncbi:MAG TPA: nuclear transport factor 2 family protein [Gemmatimonadales bacterium]|nr:nuclear transport factor 2 family protein [Gemmatimonadales bacterium]